LIGRRSLIEVEFLVPARLSDDLNPAATKCKHCGAELSRGAS
jgi:hypothetical protein